MSRYILLLTLCLMLSATVCSAAVFNGRCTWVYDGDTLLVEGVGKVRLLGIDTPEYKASQRDKYYLKRGISAKTLRRIAKKAKAFTIENAKNKRVRLETGGTMRDKHGRLLAYLYLPGGDMLNQRLLEKGLASVFRRFDFKLKPKFFKIEEKAQRKKRGLWK